MTSDNNGFLQQKRGFSTRAIHAGSETDQWRSGAIVPAIEQATAFKIPSALNNTHPYLYGRVGNPTRSSLEECLASLEDARHGLAFSSGLGAASAVLALLKAGEHILASQDIYGGTTELIQNVVGNMGVDITFTDFTNTNNVNEGIRDNTKMIWLESPTNPMIKVLDIVRVCEIARSRPAIIVVVDNTFLTPYYQRPLELGAHVSMYSLTKYMNGHSDVTMGALMLNDDELHKKLKFLQRTIGGVPSPFDCYMVLRGLKTLELRLQRHRQNSLTIAQWLEKHPRVVEVMHPELPSHLDRDIARQQSSGHTGMLSFKHAGGQQETDKFLRSLKLFTLATSLGGTESLMCYPTTMTHPSLTPEEREAQGISDSLIRVSVGLEDAEDLIEDLEQAFKAVFI